jgi:hypothetical protein
VAWAETEEHRYWMSEEHKRLGAIVLRGDLETLGTEMKPFWRSKHPYRSGTCRARPRLTVPTSRPTFCSTRQRDGDESTRSLDGRVPSQITLVHQVKELLHHPFVFQCVDIPDASPRAEDLTSSLKARSVGYSCPIP